MKPKKSPCEEPQDELFGILLEQLVDQHHPLVKLSAVISWLSLEGEFEELYSEFGRPGEPLRHLLGLEYLKYSFDMSDDEVVERWKENPYWQYFCGEKYFRYESPIDPTSLNKFRKRIGEHGAEKLLEETIRAGLELKALKPRDMKRVVVDTTVQEKAITFPTDSQLYNKMRVVLVKEAKAAGIELRQSYVRVGRKAFVLSGRYFHARQYKRGRRKVRKLKTYLGRVTRDIRRKITGNEELEQRFGEILAMSERLLGQKRNDKNKLYSIHAPEVECIAKGKAHKRYEFGNKVSVTTTARSGFIIGVQGLHGNPYDGHTLAGAIEQAEQLTKMELNGEVLVDRGYRGHNYQGAAQVHIDGQGKFSRYTKRLAKRRSVVEAEIAHMKHHSRMRRNYLLGKDGDRYNPILCGAGVNFRKLIAQIYLVLNFWLKTMLVRTYWVVIRPIQVPELQQVNIAYRF